MVGEPAEKILKKVSGSLVEWGFPGLRLSVVDGSVGPTMTSDFDPPQPAECDDPASVLAYARDRKRAEDHEAREVMKAAARWAAMHSERLAGRPGRLVARVLARVGLPLGGEGCPEVAEFAVVELAAALGRSTESGRRFLAQAVEGRYRLRRCWERLEAGDLQAFRLGYIADRTMTLPPAAAAFVDAHVAPVAHKIGPAQLGRLIEEATARFDPEQTEADRLAAAEVRHLDVDLAQVTVAGTVHVEGDLDLADALDFNTALAADAHAQLLLGSTESLDVRRSIAAGNLARAQGTLELPIDQPAPTPPRRKREVVLHVHLADAALLGAGGLARVQETKGPVTVAQVRQWCANPDTQSPCNPCWTWASTSRSAPTKRPPGSSSRPSCATGPASSRSATAPPRTATATTASPPPRSDDGGPTCTCNLAPTCRGHHRAKTTGGWTYVTVEPGVYLWRSPLGYQFLRDHTGTLDVTPDEERRRLAREFRAHFGP